MFFFHSFYCSLSVIPPPFISIVNFWSLYLLLPFSFSHMLFFINPIHLFHFCFDCHHAFLLFPFSTSLVHSISHHPSSMHPFSLILRVFLIYHSFLLFVLSWSLFHSLSFLSFTCYLYQFFFSFLFLSSPTASCSFKFISCLPFFLNIQLYLCINLSIISNHLSVSVIISIKQVCL